MRIWKGIKNVTHQQSWHVCKDCMPKSQGAQIPVDVTGFKLEK